MMMQGMRSFLAIAATILVVVAAGCSRITTDYGVSKGRTGRISVNGFGALRSAYQNAGFRNRDVTRLSERVMRTDVIVWTPQVLGSVDTKVTRWFERWLSRGDKTLVYIVPDSGSEADYWIDAAKLAPPPQRLEYRKRAAKSINERFKWRLNRSQVQSNGWFRIETLKKRQEIGQVSGPWKKALGELPEESAISVEYLIVAYDADDAANKTAPAAAPFLNSGPTGPSSPGFSMPAETTPSLTQTSYAELVRTEAKDPIVVEIQSKRWKDSSIIVVAGGSLLTNYAFSRPWNRRLVEQIITESTPTNQSDLRAGFMTSNWQAIPVSERKPGVPKASGMELLTVWPMSLVTMHGVMLGLVICLMLYPIFGRPKRIQRSEENHFGHHLDAVAALMNKSGGERYARERISEYMKRMHGETSGPWVLPEKPSTSSAKPIPKLTAKRFSRTPALPDPPAEDQTDQRPQSDDLFDDALTSDLSSSAESSADDDNQSEQDEAQR